MTGSGTQESPYIVTGWEEFLSVCNVSTSTYVEWNNGEVDFNDRDQEQYQAIQS